MADLSPAMESHLEQMVDALVANTGGEIRRHELRSLVWQCYDELAADAKVTTFLPVLTKRLAMKRLSESGDLSQGFLAGLPSVLVIDEHDSVRGQSAAALLRFYAPGRLRVSSAGTSPVGAVSHLVPEVLGEVGMDLTDEPVLLDQEMLKSADYVIAIGAPGIDPLSVSGGVDVWDIPEQLAGDDRRSVENVLAQVDEQVRAFLRRVDPEHPLHDPLLASNEASHL
jgi:arsenate reductase (thioredoxin)